MSFISGSFLLVAYNVIYPLIPNAVIIIIITIILTTSPVFMLITIVASPMSSSSFVSLKFASFLVSSIFAMFVFTPRLFSSFSHLNTTSNSLLCPASSSTFVSKVSSLFTFQYSGKYAISYPSGISSSILDVPPSSPVFVTFIWYFTIISVFAMSFLFSSSFAALLLLIFAFFPFTFIVSIVLSIPMLKFCFL